MWVKTTVGHELTRANTTIRTTRRVEDKMGQEEVSCKRKVRLLKPKASGIQTDGRLEQELGRRLIRNGLSAARSYQRRKRDDCGEREVEADGGEAQNSTEENLQVCVQTNFSS